MIGYPNAIPSLSMPRPNRTAPKPQPIPNNANTARSSAGEVAYTEKIFGTSTRITIQFKRNMPSNERVAQVCSHDQLLTIVIGRTKVLWRRGCQEHQQDRETAAYLLARFL
jgi:hypothetical protein